MLKALESSSFLELHSCIYPHYFRNSGSRACSKTDEPGIASARDDKQMYIQLYFVYTTEKKNKHTQSAEK